jgi:hypothetical protein
MKHNLRPFLFILFVLLVCEEAPKLFVLLFEHNFSRQRSLTGGWFSLKYFYGTWLVLLFALLQPFAVAPTTITKKKAYPFNGIVVLQSPPK